MLRDTLRSEAFSVGAIVLIFLAAILA